jgi:hypothetical protein
MANDKIINEVLLKCDKLALGVPLKGLEGATVGDYWSWAYSNILCNANRSILAEFVVGTVLGVVDTPRIEWDAYDLLYNDKKIEVKCSAYLQSWRQEKLSPIQYDIRKKRYYDERTGTGSKVPDRYSDCYVFCLYPEKEPCRVDILDIESWEFYVVSKDKISAEFGDQKILGLARLKTICDPVKIDKLRSRIDTEINSIGHN